ncbi:hypothetical protein [Chryseobacterium salviniae]|uniref:DUF4369 domain-containing protein n=1 Tax=Chryseobacterium salviniae TaxID=3101750 RepID=A0ABU6HST1_9FLAO|nr:hypothetical protein [Chryseobacterium sp. T9W2-O]MEC3875953.1 hypothetical protein [Chryseobacterium sp. T9W2-O]
MKKKITCLVLFFSFFAFGQKVEKDSITEKGRFVLFRAGDNKITLNSLKPINEFKEIEGILTTDSEPYLGIKFYPYNVNSEVVLQDLKNHPDFDKEFPNSTISFEGIYNITSHKTFVDSKKRNVYNKTKILAINGGLLYLFFNTVLDNGNVEDANKKISEFLKYFSIHENYFAVNTNLQN